MKILIIEDDAGIGRFLKNGLTAEGFEVNWLRTGTPAIEQVENESYAAMILDLMLPDMDGYDICREIRARNITIPICMLTARDALSDKLEGFQAGADDYLVKPFSIHELIARIKVMTKAKKNSHAHGVIEIDGLNIDRLAREISVNGTILDLTQREFDVALCLAKNAGHVVSRDQLIETAWGMDSEITANTVDVYVGYLRRKLEVLQNSPKISTIRGIGFKMT